MSSDSTTRRIGFVSLGCPKATVDSEHILTQLRAEGYAISPSYDEADLVVIIINSLSTRSIARPGVLCGKEAFLPAFLGKTLALTAKLTIMSAHCSKRVD